MPDPQKVYRRGAYVRRSPKSSAVRRLALLWQADRLSHTAVKPRGPFHRDVPLDPSRVIDRRGETILKVQRRRLKPSTPTHSPRFTGRRRG